MWYNEIIWRNLKILSLVPFVQLYNKDRSSNPLMLTNQARHPQKSLDGVTQLPNQRFRIGSRIYLH